MIKNYIKIALKVMLRRKYYTFLTLVGVSFTIMIVMVTGAFIDQVVGPNPPEIYRGRVLIVNRIFAYKEGKQSFINPSKAFLNKHVKTLQIPIDVSILANGSFISIKNKFIRGHPLKFTDERFWKINKFSFVEGKPFSAKEVATTSRVAVISESLKEYYFDNKNAYGQTIPVYGKSFKVIGVVKNAPALSNAFSDIYIPISHSDTTKEKGIDGFHIAQVLASSNKDLIKIRKELAQNMRKVKGSTSEYDSLKVSAYSSLEQFAKGSSYSQDEPEPGKTIMMLFIIMILFLLIPTISLINLNLNRIGERISEIGIRKSFGASSATLVGQFIIENIIVTLIGGAIGLILSILAADMLVQIVNYFDPLYKIPNGQFTLNYRIFGFCIFTCILFGLISGVYPALKMSRLHPIQALKGTGL